ncbi:MAG: protein-glutamate O-methyltransferase CheR [Bryobacter sp.]|jgi:chemotaxis protein methyltransferase CheR|nr:protein-glutamate O-methyltransferase CheR [Bryobacter sp.]
MTQPTAASFLSRPPAPDLTAANYRFLQEYIYKESGIVLEEDKHYLIEARLLPIVRSQSLGSLNNLCDALRTAHLQPLRQQVVDAMTTNETLWFREPAQWDALKSTVIPGLVDARKTARELNFWSAASSSGQELYTLAILLDEMNLRDFRLRLVGTDISRQMLEKARAGRYQQLEVNRGLPAPLLVKHFRRHNLEWEIRDELKRNARFEFFDLRGPMSSLGRFDIIFCRNVLIYFDNPTKQKILQEMARILAPDGWLLIGGAETVWNLDVPLVRKNIGQAVLYQKK